MTSEYQKMQCPFQEMSLETIGSQICTTCRQNAAADRGEVKHFFCNQKLAKQKRTNKIKPHQLAYSSHSCNVSTIRYLTLFSKGIVPQNNDAAIIS